VINSTYTHSFTLLKYLEQIDKLRSTVLTTAINPEIKQQLRWQATLDKTYALLAQNDKSTNNLSFNQFKKLLRNTLTPKYTSPQKQVYGYKKALDYIRFNWQIVDKKVTSKDLLKLYSIFGSGRLQNEKLSLDQLLEYLQAKSAHPILQSGIAYAEVIRFAPFTEDNLPLAHLLAYLFLYKSGFDFEGLLVFENHFKKDQNNYQNKLQQALKTSNLTDWLEYFAQSITSQLETVVKDISTKGKQPSQTQLPTNLTERQKEILALFDEPSVVITNRKIQHLFNISQITSSRDLAKLASLGLIATNGKGRSIHYTKFPKES
jgi:hypothetical protein